MRAGREEINRKRGNVEKRKTPMKEGWVGPRKWVEQDCGIKEMKLAAQ